MYVIKELMVRRMLHLLYIVTRAVAYKLELSPSIKVNIQRPKGRNLFRVRNDR